MLNSSRTLAFVLTFVACSTLVACTTPPPTDVTNPRSAGVCGDSWTPTGSMAVGRYIATATRLSDSAGSVLVAGGTTDTGLATGAERYNPTTGSWSAAGTMITPRYFHRAALLGNGKVLVVGGYSDQGPTASAEIYDPGSNSWSAAAPMSTDRYAPQIIALPGGKVLVSGGIGGGMPSLASAEIYDPGSNSWSPAGTMRSARYLAGITLLPSGKVLVAGGHNGTDYLSSAEIFDPASKTWTAAASMSVPRYAFGMSVLPAPDGRVVAAGGSDGAPGAEFYDPAVGATGAWSPTTAMNQVPRWFFETVSLADGRILVAGGVGGTGFLDGAELYDVGIGGWSPLSAMSTSRYLAASAELLDGRILVAGGFTVTSTGAGLASDTAETYLPCPPNARPVAVCQNRTISAGPTCKGASVSIDNGSYDPDNGPVSPLMFSQAPSAPFNLGSTPVTLSVNDGNLGATCSATVTVVDNTPPTITCPSHQTLECVNGGASATYTATITDNCDSPRTVTCTPGGRFPFGNTTVTCSGTDASGNTRSCNFTASVVDTQPPTAGQNANIFLVPDNTMQGVPLMSCAGFLVDACDGRLIPLKDHGTIHHITSDEPAAGDISIPKTWQAQVRAKSNAGGNGRVYTIYYQITDLHGNPNPTLASCTVRVGANAIAGPPVYCYGQGC